MLSKEWQVRNQKFNLGVVGATGLVGREMLKVLEERAFPVRKLYLWASQNSEGEEIKFQSKNYRVEVLEKQSFEEKGLDYVLFATKSGVSAEYAPLAAQEGAIVIDNSSHFRLDKSIPLVVPEVNPEDIQLAEKSGIIANPNCSTAQLVVCLKALHDAVPLKRVLVSTYQSVSGAGSKAMEELQNQVGALFAGQEVIKKNFPHQIAFNCIPHIDIFYENGMTKEEMKLICETRKILGLPQLKISATAVRVPVFISHSESVNLEFEEELSVEEAKDILSNTPGVVLLDDPNQKIYPTPFELAGKDEVYVGRVRRDESAENGLHLWVVADNLRKGAATNAVQIAELCVEKNFSRRAAA